MALSQCTLDTACIGIGKDEAARHCTADEGNSLKKWPRTWPAQDRDRTGKAERTTCEFLEWVGMYTQSFSPHQRAVPVNPSNLSIRQRQHVSHPDVMTSVAWSPSGNRIATGCWDGTVAMHFGHGMYWYCLNTRLLVTAQPMREIR